MSNYTTGEMAKLCDVSVRTVQFYDHKGILHPSSESDGGRRIYNDNDLTKMRLICTLRAIGLSLVSIKSIMDSDMSGKIFSILLDEQLNILSAEMEQRQRQVKMIHVMKESIANKTIVPVNSILDIEQRMKNNFNNRLKLTLIYMTVAIVVILGTGVAAWLITSQFWWGLGAYIIAAVFGITVTLLSLRNVEFICPNCDAAFTPKLLRAFFTTGDHKVRWMRCPACDEKNWCVMRK